MANPRQLFKRNTKWKKGVFRTLATDVIVHGKIETTEAKAKELRKYVDKLITYAKHGSLADRRKAESFLRNVSTKNGISVGRYLFETLSLKYKDRNGGYVRIIKSPTRKSDNAKMAIIELV